MERTGYLLDQLIEYGKSDAYPFHMPGHKRQTGDGFGAGFPNPFSIDITEIDGFDNLHHPEGILKESMEWAAGIYGADRTYYLVNGSSCGVLSAVCGTTGSGGKLLMGRGCHKSAYHGAMLNRLNVRYVYPRIIDDFGIQGGYLPEEIEKLLTKEPDIQAVLLVSPTYEGIVSDVENIAAVVHQKGIPLIVDEAHGAHFPYAREVGAPVTALDLGADVVIQSLHKTLPSFTQTAVMHVRRGYIDMDRIDRYVHVFQSSSPSYVLMAGIENCIRWMDTEGRGRMRDFYRRLDKLRSDLGRMRKLRLLPEAAVGRDGVYALDVTKIIISCRNTHLSGPGLGEILRSRYGLEMEMCGPDYVTAITTAADSEEGLNRLRDGLLKIDQGLWEDQIGQKYEKRQLSGEQGNERVEMVPPPKEAPTLSLQNYPAVACTIAEALDANMELVDWKDAAGKISGEFIYIYPPGIPIAAPGEVITESVIELILDYREKGLPIQGMRDESGQTLRVVCL